jgi:hypothetical protein
MNFLFITSTNLATNPRLLREIDLAINLKFTCTVLQFKFDNWSDIITDELKINYPTVNFVEFSATRNNFFNWLFSSIIEKICRFIPIYFLNTKLLSFSINKRSILLYRYLKTVNSDFDWVIAHNPPAFYPACYFAIKNNSKLGIDIEDYHPGESYNNNLKYRMSELMNKTIHHANYCTFASPLIRDEVFSQISSNIKNHIILYNSFKQKDFKLLTNKNSKIKLVWYSQNIDFGRGLEFFIPAFKHFCDTLELHLIGNLNKSFYLEYIKNSDIIVHSPISPNKLNSFLSNFDVGLALDFGKDLNNNLAISNKIISYAQAGLWIFSFKTKAKISFINDFNLHCTFSSLDEEDIICNLNNLISLNFGLSKINQFKKAKNLSWDNLSIPLIDIWKNSTI